MARTTAAIELLLIKCRDDHAPRVPARMRVTGSSASRSWRRPRADDRTAALRGMSDRPGPFQISCKVCWVASPNV